MKSLRIIVLLLSSLSLYGMDNELPSRIESPARAASQDVSPFESPATQRANAELNGLADKDTPRRGALAQALAELAFKPTEIERNCTHTIIGTSKDAPLQETEKAEKKRCCEDDSDNNDSDSNGDENKPPLEKRRRLVFMRQLEQPNWSAKLAAAQQQQIDIGALKTLAQFGPPVAANSLVSTMQQEAAAQKRLEKRKLANEPEQPPQKKPRLHFTEAAGQGQPAMEIGDVEIAAAMKIDSDDL